MAIQVQDVRIEIIVHEERCIGCGNCTAVCPVNNTVTMRVESGKLKSGFLCEGCGLCVKVCPFNALELVVEAPKEPEEIETPEVKREEVEAEVVEKEQTHLEKLEKKEIKIKRFPDYISEWFSTGLLRRMFEASGDINVPEVIKKFEKAGDIFSLLYMEVIGRKLCSLCGACISACQEGVLRITVDGKLSYPHLIEECRNCASCLLKCPKTDYFKLEESEDELGSYIDIISARRAGKGDEKKAGAATVLLKYAMEKEIIDCAIVVGDEPSIVTKPEELEKFAGIKFVVAPTLSLLKEAIKMGYRKIAVVGVPCQAKAARKMKMLGNDEIKLIMGVFCPRGKHPEKEALSCKVCRDMSAEFADISFGNTGSQKGWRTIIVRTEIGKQIVDGVLNEGLLRVGRVDLEKLKQMAARKKFSSRNVG
ncbi:MAG: hypothetical protein DSY33_00095 [Archaeoglobus sp.]|nr:MAG: hypothetical protein DSY33_00095 [Archaeoglobus sp.]